MPSDTLYGNKCKYILAGIDAASRFKVARPLRTKQARNVAEMIADIYKVGPLKYPKIFQCDTEMIGMKPKDAIKLDEVPLVDRECYPPEDVLPEDGLYRYLLQPDEENDDQRRKQWIGYGERELTD